MLQTQSGSGLEAPNNDSIKLANIELDLSVIRPNGLFPPELIVLLLQYADIPTCVRAASSCKLWFETVQSIYQYKYLSRYYTPNNINDDLDVNWKAEFFKQQIIENNLRKGLWWAEEQMSTHYPSYDFFGYVSSFSGNKMILNAHHIHQTSYSNNKYFTQGYLIDLDTMKKVKVPYGTIFANGYTLQTLNKDAYDFLSWKEFIVSDGSTQYVIKCKSILEAGYIWERKFHYLLVNMNGSPQILIYTFRSRRYDESPDDTNFEVYDLTTGKLLAEAKAVVHEIKAFFGDVAVAITDQGLTLINLYTNERVVLPGDITSQIYFANNILAISGEHLIRFYDGLTLKVLREIDWAAILLENGIIFEGDEIKANVLALSFDKWKLVLAIDGKVLFYVVIDLETLKLVQTMVNGNWGDAEKIALHLAPNGKIVTDCTNLTVYDFNHPNLRAKMKVAFFEDGKKVQMHTINAIDLKKFAAEKLNVIFDQLQTETFYRKVENEDGTGVRHRITLFAEDNKKNLSRTDKLMNERFLKAWKSSVKRKNGLRLTTTDVNSIDSFDSVDNPHVSWKKILKMVVVFERKNKVTKRWEFCEPFGLNLEEDIIDITDL